MIKSSEYSITPDLFMTAIHSFNFYEFIDIMYINKTTERPLNPQFYHDRQSKIAFNC